MAEGRDFIPGALTEQRPRGILVMHLPDDVPGWRSVSGTCPPRGGACLCVEGNSFKLMEVFARARCETAAPCMCPLCCCCSHCGVWLASAEEVASRSAPLKRRLSHACRYAMFWRAMVRFDRHFQVLSFLVIIILIEGAFEFQLSG